MPARTALTTICTASSPGRPHWIWLPPAGPKVVTSRPVRHSKSVASGSSVGCDQAANLALNGRNMVAIAAPLAQRTASRLENSFFMFRTLRVPAWAQNLSKCSTADLLRVGFAELGPWFRSVFRGDGPDSQTGERGANGRDRPTG